jgi:hypothetical protein
LKLTPASQIIMNNPGDYFDIFGFTNITVEKIYPSPIPEEKYIWDLYSNKPPSIRSKKVTQFPILLYDQTQNIFYFAVMTVEVFFQ